MLMLGKYSAEDVLRILDGSSVEGKVDVYTRMSNVIKDNQANLSNNTITSARMGAGGQLLSNMDKHFLDKFIFLNLAHVRSKDVSLANEALRALGFLIHQQSIATEKLTPGQAKQIVAQLVEVVTNTKQKPACNLALWCLAVQR